MGAAWIAPASDVMFRGAIPRSRRLAVALAMSLLAVGCAGLPEGVYRDTAAPMGMTTRFAADRFAGDWRVVARFGDTPVGPMRFDAARGNLIDLGTGRVLPVNRRRGVAIMWVDADFRTAALGTADGRVGFVLNRGAPVSPDRLAAARDIMEFYGWETGQLRPPG